MISKINLLFELSHSFNVLNYTKTKAKSQLKKQNFHFHGSCLFALFLLYVRQTSMQLHCFFLEICVLLLGFFQEVPLKCYVIAFSFVCNIYTQNIVKIVKNLQLFLRFVLDTTVNMFLYVSANGCVLGQLIKKLLCII